jgi:hypothetical protein
LFIIYIASLVIIFIWFLLVNIPFFCPMILIWMQDWTGLNFKEIMEEADKIKNTVCWHSLSYFLECR